MIGTKAKPITDKLLTPSLNGAGGSTGETTVVAAGTRVEGKFHSTENVRLDGFVKGEVKCSQRLVMGETGKVEGTVRTQDAIVMGTIEGEIHADGTLHLKGTALIRGTIQAKFMVVDEGARYVGECRIGSN